MKKVFALLAVIGMSVAAVGCEKPKEATPPANTPTDTPADSGTPAPADSGNPES